MAMGVNKNRALRNTRSFNNLTLLSVACPVCMGILIEPVTLPCNHDLCLECFEKTVENNSLTCPICRKRIGGWLRKAKDKSLVNESLWNIIQKKFPSEIEAKLRGDDDGVADRLTEMIPPRALSCAGEIQKEFALEVKKYEEEIRRKQEEEQKASLELIKKLQEEENKKLFESSLLIKQDEELAKQVQESVKKEESLEAERLKRRQTEDEILARKLQEVLMESSEATIVKSEKKENLNIPSTSTITPVKGPMDSFVYQMKQNVSGGSSGTKVNMEFDKKINRSRSQSNDSVDSGDSLRQELVHFKPIRIVPRTPPKKMPDGRVIEPCVVVASPLRISDLCEAVNKGRKLTPAVRRLAENMKITNSTITPPSKGKISNLGTSQSSAFRVRDFVRKLDPYQQDQTEMVCEPQKKKIRVERKVFEDNYEQSPKGSSKDGQHIRHNNNASFSTFVSTLDTTLSPIEVCRSAEEDDLAGISHISDNFGVGCESPAKTSTDSGKISLEEDSSKMPLPEEVLKITVDNDKGGYEALFYKNKENNSSLTVNNNNVETRLESRECAIRDSGIEDDNIVTEQSRLEQMIQQEQEDLRLAMELQRKWEMEDRIVDRRKGTSRAYELRNTSVSKTATKTTKRVINKGGRQRTLEETFHSGNQRLVANSGH